MASALHEEQFNPDAYIAARFSFCEPHKLGEKKDLDPFCREWALGKFHEFYSTLSSNSAAENRLQILEFGGGPVIYSLISAAPYAERIVFSEFVGRNRDVVDSWRIRESNSHDFRSIFKTVVQSVEGRDDEEVEHREQELRDKIVSVIPCDVRQDPPLDPSVQPGSYDVVSTHFCLAVACESVEMYAEALRKLSAYVRPGGYILSSDGLGQTFYTLGDARFPCLTINKEIIEKSLIDAGFTEEFRFHSLPLDLEISDGKEVAVFSARKCR